MLTKERKLSVLEPFEPVQDFRKYPQGFIREIPKEFILGPDGRMIMTGPMQGTVKVVGYAPCRYTKHHGHACGCKKKILGIRELPVNLCTNVFAKFVQAAIMGQTTTITDTGGSGRSVTKTVDGGVATRTGAAGTSGTAATVADTALGAETETTTSVTINAVTGSGSSGTFTTTYTVTATAIRAYAEVGLRMTTTTTAWVFLITRDTFSVLNVSDTGWPRELAPSLRKN